MQRGELYKLFRKWVRRKYPSSGVISEQEWEEVMADDATKRYFVPCTLKIIVGYYYQL